MVIRTIWRIDLINPLPKVRGAVNLAMVAIYYFMKLVEVESLSKITENKATNFEWRNAIWRYRIPHAHIMDNGKQFENHNFKKFCEKLNIELIFCLPAH